MTDIEREDISRILASPLPWNEVMGSTVLVTGATGMLASYMVFTLLELLRRHPASGTRLVLACHHPEKARRRFGDLVDLEGVEIVSWDGVSGLDIDATPDLIVHAASIADSSRYMTNPVETALPNVIGTWRLLELARRRPGCRLLFFSSASAYGRVVGHERITEDMDGRIVPSELRSCYGEGKRMGETLCACYAAEHDVSATAVRISHTYGPTMDLRTDTRVFAEFVRNVIAGEDIVMKSDGRAMRAFCYLADACEAFFRVLLLGEPGRVYNMANDRQFVSILELAETIAGLFPERGLCVRRKEREASDTYAENYNANTDVLSADRLRSLGWEPGTTIEEGFRRTILSLESERGLRP